MTTSLPVASSASGAPAEWWRATPAPVADSRLPFAALMAFTFILILAPQTFFPVLGAFRIAMMAAVVAITSYVANRFMQGRPLSCGTREMSTAAWLATWATVTVPFSYWPGGSIAFLTGTYFKTLAVFWLLGNVVNTIARLRAIAWGLALMSAPLALTGINNFLSGSFIVVAPGVQASVNRIKGYDAPLALNPNDLALLLNLIIPMGMALFLSSRKPLARAAASTLVALAAVAVILTFSRAGFLTLAVIFAIYMWKLRRRPEARWMWGAAVVALACTVVLPSGYGDRLSTIIDIDADPTGSAQTRWTDTQAAVHLVLSDPIIGAGVGQNVLALNDERGVTWTEVHNVYLQYAVELGLPGLVLFVLLLTHSLRSTAFAQRQATDERTRDLYYLAEGIQVSLLAFAVAALFYPGGYQFGFYYFAGLAAATRVIAGASTS
jgi:O-antigen ligase